MGFKLSGPNPARTTSGLAKTVASKLASGKKTATKKLVGKRMPAYKSRTPSRADWHK